MAARPAAGAGAVHGCRRPLRPVHGVAVAAALGRVNDATVARCGRRRRGQCTTQPRRPTLAQPAASEAHGQLAAGAATIVVADATAVWGTAVSGGTAWSARRQAVGVLLGVAGIATTGVAPCGTWLRRRHARLAASYSYYQKLGFQEVQVMKDELVQVVKYFHSP
ncbi:hypothetical protein E2562_028286 [Oryza meyeriana var. granulata]|uniref:Uncharacterized protein n=1 Tax=Oryza meyeriana var. granulata TaxID=110450 RepID=A0A6G1E3D3_9ORYZ|nr:hypothetical protein E2562_028286 [Oryza meyeriana var. granulata]